MLLASLEWVALARGRQYRPGPAPESATRNWLVVGGRGSGKTRLGAEWVNALVRGFAPFSAGVRHMRIALVGETLGDVREVMVDGPSGIASISRWNRPRYEPTRRRLLWDTGAVAQAFSSEDPESLRGPQFEAAWCDELGCPAVDKGANQPNVFPDAKSSEDATPYFSSGGRSDVAQARFLQAHFAHWDPQSPHFDASANPVSPVYGGRMVDPARICVWAWDARPFPAFPTLAGIWRDGDNWHRGHWLNGRLSTAPVGDLLAAILADHGLAGVDRTQGGRSIAGYVVDRPLTARAALEPLADLFGVVVRDDNGVLELCDERGAGASAIVLSELALAEGGAVVERSRAPERDLANEMELSFADPFRDYQAAVARLARPGNEGSGARTVAFPGFLEAGAAEALLADWMQRGLAGRETVGFAVPASEIDVAPGVLVSLPGGGEAGEFLVTEVETGAVRKASARHVRRIVPAPWRAGRIAAARPDAPSVYGAPHALLLDLPMLPGAQFAHEQFKVAAFARPWRSQLVFSSPQDDGFAHTATVPFPATVGEVVAADAGLCEGRYDRIGRIIVALHNGALLSVSLPALLNGANTAAMQAANGQWEVLQFAEAEEVSPSVWELGFLLRGQSGTGGAAAAGAPAGAAFVLLDDAVVKAGLAPELAGLPLNWRIGPSGRDFGGPHFAALAMAGGIRARLPLSPVHLRGRRLANGDLELTWVRRGRIDADSWLGEDIPLGEESERYRLEFATSAGEVRRAMEVAAPGSTYAAALQAQDFPTRPAEVSLTVRQVSAVAGPGLPARAILTLY